MAPCLASVLSVLALRRPGDRIEIHRQTYMLVQRRSWAGSVIHEFLAFVAVPSKAKAIDVEQTIARRNLRFCGFLARYMGYEFWEIVSVDLLGEGVGWSYQDVFQKAGLARRDVGEPAAHVS